MAAETLRYYAPHCPLVVSRVRQGKGLWHAKLYSRDGQEVVVGGSALAQHTAPTALNYPYDLERKFVGSKRDTARLMSSPTLGSDDVASWSKTGRAESEHFSCKRLLDRGAGLAC